MSPVWMHCQVTARCPWKVRFGESDADLQRREHEADHHAVLRARELEIERLRPTSREYRVAKRSERP